MNIRVVAQLTVNTFYMVKYPNLVHAKQRWLVYPYVKAFSNPHIDEIKFSALSHTHTTNIIYIFIYKMLQNYIYFHIHSYMSLFYVLSERIKFNKSVPEASIFCSSHGVRRAYCVCSQFRFI